MYKEKKVNSYIELLIVNYNIITNIYWKYVDNIWDLSFIKKIKILSKKLYKSQNT